MYVITMKAHGHTWFYCEWQFRKCFLREFPLAFKFESRNMAIQMADAIREQKQIIHKKYIELLRIENALTYETTPDLFAPDLFTEETAK